MHSTRWTERTPRRRRSSSNECSPNSPTSSRRRRISTSFPVSPATEPSRTGTHVRPLLITAMGRAISSSPLGRRVDDVEVRRVPALPSPATLDPDRVTVIVLDRYLLHSAGGDHERLRDLATRVAFVGLGDA